MKMVVKLSPKRFFGFRSKSRSHVSRSNPSSFSSSSSSGTPTSVLPSDVSLKELEDVMARLGGSAPTPAEVEEVLGCGADGCVTMDALMARLVGPHRDVELRETFDFFDADGDGRITEEELLGVFRAMGDDRCTLEDCRRMVAGVDENGNGFVCFADFARMMDPI